MTAIVWAYGESGFVIAADGRRMEGAGVNCDEVQKIFSVKVGYLRLVYAWKGNTYLEMTNGTIVDFTAVTDCIVQTLDIKNIGTFSEFVEKFRDALFPVSRLLFESKLQEFPLDKPIVGVVFLAYFGGHPYFAEIEVWHDGNKILRPDATSHPACGTFGIFSGSKMAKEEFGKCDQTSFALPHLANEAKRYIETCFKYQGMEKEASGIGGWIHMGQLEPDGFLWLIPPKHKNQ